MTHFTPSFPRYLAAKKTVDDRALNGHVWEALQAAVGDLADWRVLEVGAGIGTMAERWRERGFWPPASYLALDADAENVAVARQRLAGEERVAVTAVDLFDFIPQTSQTWDLLVAHAFLDLLDSETALPQLFRLLRPGGLAYFTINFDGATILQPKIDPVFDALIEALYHRTMDERVVNGRFSGDSQTGRHLFHHIPQAGGQILAAGSSDWVIFAGPGGYPADEAYFLHFIIHTMQSALQGHPELDPTRFAAWIAQRHAQIERHELVYIAHQLDFLASVDSSW
jgi:SAM-dependent methyltransferase